MVDDPNQPPLPSTESPKPSQPGWLGDLARRSTGLPADESLPSTSSSSSDTSLWRLAGLGVQFAITVSMFALLGREADRRMGWSPWGVISFTLLAVVGNLYLLIKEAMREDAPQPKKMRKKK